MSAQCHCHRQQQQQEEQEQLRGQLLHLVQIVRIRWTHGQSGMGLDPPFRDSLRLVPLLRFPSFWDSQFGHPLDSPEAVTIPRYL